MVQARPNCTHSICSSWEIFWLGIEPREARCFLIVCHDYGLLHVPPSKLPRPRSAGSVLGIFLATSLELAGCPSLPLELPPSGPCLHRRGEQGERRSSWVGACQNLAILVPMWLTIRPISRDPCCSLAVSLCLFALGIQFFVLLVLSPSSPESNIASRDAISLQINKRTNDDADGPVLSSMR